MRRIKVIITYSVLTILCNVSYGQLLSIDETVNYLEQELNNDLRSDKNIIGGEKKIKVLVDEDKKIVLRYYWRGNEDVLFPDFIERGIDYNEIEIDVEELSLLEERDFLKKKAVTVKCKDGTKHCVKVNTEALMWHYSQNFCDRPEAINHYDYVHLFYLNDTKTQSKISNGFSHLLYEVYRQGIEEELENPFNEYSESKTVNREIVQLGKQGGVSILSLNLGGVSEVAILDSGASDVSIPRSLESQLLTSKMITSEDYLQSGLYTIADGSIVESKRFVIPFIKLDGVEVPNVTCSVNQSKDIILLGKAFLDRFKSWKIDNELNQLILEY